MSRPSPRSFTPLAALAVLLFSPAARADAPKEAAADPLPRRGFFGAQVAPVPPEVREREKLGQGEGVLVLAVVPGSTAEKLGLKAGDVVTAVGDAKVSTPQGLVSLVAAKTAGDPFAFTYVRGGKAETKSDALQARPRETGTDDYDVVYGSVESKGVRLRTLLTRPKKAPASGKTYPALFLIQGIGSFSVENYGRGQGAYAREIEAFARNGYVTFRVDKPGQGDSRGGPTQDVDFETEVDGYRQGLKALKATEGVDPDRVVVFGHSMGGVIGPILAAENPVKGIAAYGTVARTWQEYMIENTRRQMALAGDDFAKIDRVVRQDARIMNGLNAEGLTPAEVAKRHPELKDRIDETVQDGSYVAGRHYGFFRQLAATNLAEAWSKFEGRALAGWGKADFVSAEADHALIAEIVNRAHPGHGTFLVVDDSDHGFHRAGSQAESFKQSGGPGENNPAFLDAMRQWADALVKPAAPK